MNGFFIAMGTTMAPAFLNPSLIDELASGVNGLKQSLSGLKLAIPSIRAGGFGGVLSWARGAGAVLGKLSIVTTIVSTIIFGILEGYKLISDKMTEIDMKFVALEADLGILQASYQRSLMKIQSLESQVPLIEQKVNLFEAGLVNVEFTANEALSTGNEALSTANEALNEVSNLEELIKANHTESLQKFQTAEEFQSTNFGDIADNFTKSFTWQENNGAAPTATLTRAGIERTDGMLFKAHKQIFTATEGYPSIAEGDADYYAEIANGTAIIAGTLGYSAWKNRTAIQGSIEAAKSVINGGMNEIKNQGKKVGALVNLGQILQVVTLITTVHNALILSRDIGQTLFSVVDNGLNAALNALGIKDVDDEGVNTDKALKDFINSVGASIFGVRTWTQVQASWAAANRITASANTLLWSVRDLADTTSSMAEMAAENSGKIGNLLRRSGVTQDVGRWFPENYSRETVFQQKMRESLENTQNIAEAFENITSNVLQTQQTIKEIKDNNDAFMKTLETETPKIRVDNKPVKDASIAAKAASQGPDITEVDTKPSSLQEE
ncbi:hypothetical protein [Argonema antarcticum]|uniref:hypothetical protein n=1 Tax=Argonema antarcticum TaxID=2942763 RepID=UPI00201268A9|nr:hypothetical protein [Argonema antarcticum]MCL1474419.1 hypothetical protein [Argonema antarcticum A004/B2]